MIVIKWQLSIVATVKMREAPFCYVCGEFTVKKKQRTVNEHIRKLYATYYDTKINVATWTPQYCCTSCYEEQLVQQYCGA